MNISLFSDWVEEQLFGDGEVAHFMADIIDEAMSCGAPDASNSVAHMDYGLFESAWAAAKDAPEDVRARVATVLGRLGFQSATSVLESAAKSTNTSVARPAAIALAYLRAPDEGLLAMLSEALQDPSESHEIRSAAARAIGTNNAVETTSYLARIAAADDPDLAQYGIEGLGFARPTPGSEEHRRALEVLLAALASKDPNIRLTAIDALGRFGDRKAIPPLEGVLIEKDAGVRRRALFALAKLGADSAKAPLARMLRDISIPARWEIVDLLGESYGEAMVDALAGAAKDRDAEIRDHVVRALAKMKGRPSLDLLERIARDDSDSFVREQAESALAERSRRAAEPDTPEAVATAVPADRAAPPLPSVPAPTPQPPAPAPLQPGRTPAKLQPLYEAPPQSPPEPNGAPANVIESALEAMGCTWRLDADAYRVEVPHAHKTEKVSILLGEADFEDSPVYRFVVNCGPARNEAFEAALRNNRFLDYGSVAIADATGQPAFVLTDTMPAESATVASVRKTLLSLARAAAELRG